MLALRIRPPVPANLQRKVPEGGMTNTFQQEYGLLPDLLILDCGEHANVHNYA